MNDTLKAAGRIGAELGAAKAKVERLRELLRDVEFRGLLTGWEPGLIGQITAALSQQAEPVRSPRTEDTASMDSNSEQEQFTAVDMATAAAQGFRDGQAAVEHQSLNEWFLSLEPGRQAVLREDKWMLANAAFEAGYATRHAQTAPKPEQSGLYTCIGKGGAYELIGRATTAGVLKVTGRFADEVIVYRDTESNALYCREPGDFRLRMARAALAARGGAGDE